MLAHDPHDDHPAEINAAAAVGFDRQAASYSRVRPAYPQEVVDLFVAEGHLSERASVLDLASGTGIFTRQLQAAGLDVMAVEPVSGMRSQFAIDTPGYTAIDGTAEHLPLDDASVDAVAVAQAFHWFDHQPALREIARVLRPGGLLMLVWNARDDSVAWMNAWGDLVARFGGGRPYEDHREMLWEDVVEESGAYTALQKRSWPNNQDGGPDLIIERTRSTSFIAALPDDRHAEALREVGKLIATHPETAGRATITIPYVTKAYWSHKLR